MKFILKNIILLTILFLAGCGANKEEIINVKIGDFVFGLSKNYYISDVSLNKLSNDFEIIYKYKEKSNNLNFAPSIIIAQYKGKFPSNKEKFFSIIMDKFRREVAGSIILDEENFDLDKQHEIYYFTYKVFNNMFQQSEYDKDVYYGLQAYLFEKNNNVYVISYLCKNNDQLNTVIDKIKDLKLK